MKEHCLATSTPGESFTVFCGGTASQFVKHAIEMGEGLKTNRVSDFADTCIRIQKQVLGLFDTDPRQVIREVDPGRLLEHFAEIKRAGVGAIRSRIAASFITLQ